ncbi:MAG: hypothetical protein ABW250_10390 [Pyrinomonadaceae bacterium]
MNRLRRSGILVSFADYWWCNHTSFPPGPNYDNVGRSDWRPDYVRMPTYLALLIAVFWFAPYLQTLGSGRWAQPVARGAIWFLLLALAFSYVSKVTSRRRRIGIRGRHGGFRDFWIVQGVGFVAFVMEIHHSSIVWEEPSASRRAASLIIPFLCGLHISYVEKLPAFLNRSTNLKNWRNGGTGTRVWMIARLAGLAYLMSRLMPADAWRYLCLAVVVLAAGMWLITYRLKPFGYYGYLHHWFVALVLALAGVASPPLHAFFMAVFIEGAARFSCAPLWHQWSAEPSRPTDRDGLPARVEFGEPRAEQVTARGTEC